MNSKTRIFIFTRCENNYFPNPIKPDFEISSKTLFLRFLAKSKKYFSDFFHDIFGPKIVYLWEFAPPSVFAVSTAAQSLAHGTSVGRWLFTFSKKLILVNFGCFSRTWNPWILTTTPLVRVTGHRNSERAEFPTFKSPQTWYATALGVDCHESTDRTMIAAYPVDISKKNLKNQEIVFPNPQNVSPTFETITSMSRYPCIIEHIPANTALNDRTLRIF